VKTWIEVAVISSSRQQVQRDQKKGEFKLGTNIHTCNHTVHAFISFTRKETTANCLILHTATGAGFQYKCMDEPAPWEAVLWESISSQSILPIHLYWKPALWEADSQGAVSNEHSPDDKEDSLKEKGLTGFYSQKTLLVLTIIKFFQKNVLSNLFQTFSIISCRVSMHSGWLRKSEHVCHFFQIIFQKLFVKFFQNFFYILCGVSMHSGWLEESKNVCQIFFKNFFNTFCQVLKNLF